MAGGYMDAYAYLAHGHVFANSQTGNVVLFSVAASQGHWAQAGRHLPPILAFAAGVAVAKYLDVHFEQQSVRATLFCQAFAVTILTGVANVGAYLPDASVVPIISFVAALQNTSLSRIGPWSFNSAITTGNLRDATSGLVLWIAGQERAASRRKAVTLGLICLAFLVGALCGGSYARLDTAHALLPCVATVALGFLLTAVSVERS